MPLTPSSTLLSFTACALLCSACSDSGGTTPMGVSEANGTSSTGADGAVGSTTATGASADATGSSAGSTTTVGSDATTTTTTTMGTATTGAAGATAAGGTTVGSATGGTTTGMSGATAGSTDGAGASGTAAGGSMTGAAGASGATDAGGSTSTTAGSGGSAGGTGTTTAGGSANVEPQPGCGSTKWACWPMPNPAGSGLPNEASYTDMGDTVLDDVTGLLWEKIENLRQVVVKPNDENITWQDAMDYCDGLSLGGYDDWRAPTRIEMTSIVDYSRSGTKIDSSAFPSPPGAFHRTASIWILVLTDQTDLDVAWSFNLSDGIVSNNYNRSSDGGVRCVRSDGSGEAPDEPAVAPPNQYTLLSGEEAQDNYTGLIWQRQDSDAYLSWEEAVDYCANLSVGGQSWRLPSIREAATLVDEAQVAPAINREVFPGTIGKSRSNDWYWASHRAQGNNSAAWAINFDDGFTGANSGSGNDWNAFTAGYARCVR